MGVSSAGLEIPVLIIAFNRPSETAVVLDQLANVAPNSPFYIWQDGPKDTSLIDDKFLQTREIVKVFASQRSNTCLMLNDINMGCRVSVKKAIDWFFSNVDFGIICEDDVIISHQYFDFVGTYKSWCEKKGNVGIIGGHSLVLHDAPFLNMHGSVWGWASWSDVWSMYSETVDLDLLQTNIQKYYFKREAKHEFVLLKNFYESPNTLHTWDYHWLKTRIENEILTLMPKRPLTLNIGFSGAGTHYSKTNIPHFIKNSSRIFSELTLSPQTSIQSEPFIEPELNPCSHESQKYFLAKFSKLTKLKNYINFFF